MSTDHRIRRRSVLRAGAFGLAAIPLTASRALAIVGANETVRVAVAGIRNRGKSLAGGFAAEPSVEVTALAEVDSDPAIISPALKEVERAGAAAPRVEPDWRRLLDDRAIDGLVVATPDHWHAPMTIAACRAGKDVYVEKPASHNVAEGAQMLRVARETERIVQVGTQRRSQPMMREACEFVRSGAIGHVAMTRAWMTSTRPNLGHVADSPTPTTLDWNLWRGPAPMRPYNVSRCHYHWRWFWDTGTGEIGNNGVHLLDVARWGLGVDHPTRVVSAGGQLVHKDDRETPDTHLVSYELPGDRVLTWEHRIWSSRGLDDWDWGIAFYGEKGTVLLRDQEWKLVEPDGKETRHEGASGWRQHLAEFASCVRSRARPSADIEVGHLSTVFSHLGNIAHRSGLALRWNGERCEGADAEAANALLTRSYREGFELATR